MITAASPEPSVGTADRPQGLDESDLRQFCLLVSRGCSVKEAASCVDCKLSDLRHERETNGWFRRKLARAKIKAKLAPLRAMQKAMLKDWRAAAWFLERTQPEKFGRRTHRAFTQKQANALIKDVTSIIGEESISKWKFDRTSSRVEAAIRYACRAHNDINRTAAELGRAMKHHDMKSPRYSPALTDFSVDLPAPKSNGAARNTPPAPPLSTASRTTTLPLASGASPNLMPPTPPHKKEPARQHAMARGTDCRPNVTGNPAGAAQPIVDAAHPQEATRGAAFAQPPSPQRGGS